jgi:zinc transport system permease protein
MGEVGFWESAFLWRDPMIAACVGGVLLSLLGFFIVPTKNAFVSAAISQLAGLGVVFAILLGAHGESLLPLFVGIAFGVIGASLFALPRRGKRVGTDAILAMAFVGASGLTLVLAKFLTREYQHVQAALYGDAVVASPNELYLVIAVAVVVGIVHLLFGQRFLMVSFDPDSARAQGMATGGWAFFLGFTLALSIAVMTRAMGALVAFSFSVVPTSAALLLMKGLRPALGVAAFVGLVSAGGGYLISFFADLPTGPTMVTLSLVFLLPGWTARMLRRN